MRRLILLVLATAVLVVGGALPAWADYVRPLPDPDRPGVAVGVTGTLGQGNSEDGGSDCGFFPLDPSNFPILTDAQQERPGQPGKLYAVSCPRPGRPSWQQQVQVEWVPDAAPADPEALAREAARRLQLPEPALGVNPPPDAQEPPLVNLPVWLWVEPASWQPVEATAAVPGMWATVRATPVQVTWSTGDGGQVVCEGPGQPYTAQAAGQRPSCGHTYTQPGRYEVTATITYQVRWSSPAGGGELPAVVSSSSLSVPVGELSALN